MSLLNCLRSGKRKTRRPKRANRAARTVERLDDRRMLAPVLYNGAYPFSANGTELSFTDDASSTAIVIEHDGSYGANNVKLKTYDRYAYDDWQAGLRSEPPKTTDGNHQPGTVASLLAGKSFWKITVNDLGGNDKVVYNLPNGVRDGVYNEIDVRLGHGNDSFKATINGMGYNAGIRVLADGYTGNDRLETEVHGRLRDRSSLGVSMNGGAGVDDVHVDAWDSVQVDRGAMLWANLNGRGGASPSYYADLEDTVALWYLGQMDGALQYNITGGEMGDSLMANIWANGGSTGRVGVPGRDDGARILGDNGHDQIYYYARGDSLNWYHPVVDGGSGTDTLHQLSVVPEGWIFTREMYDNDHDDSSGPVRRVDRFFRD